MSRTIYTVMSDPFFDAMLTLRQSDPPRNPPRPTSTPSISDWEIESTDQPTDTLASANVSPFVPDSLAVRDMDVSTIWEKIRDLERQREEDRHTVLGLTKRLDDQAKALDSRDRDRQTLQNLYSRVRNLESTVDAMNTSSRNKKPEKPLLNMDLHDSNTHYDRPHSSRPSAYQSQYDSLLVELKDELLEWARKELPGAAYSQINLGKGGRKRLKAEVRDDILSQIYVPISNRAMDAIADEVIERTEYVVTHRLAREAVGRRTDFEEFKVSLKQSIRVLVEESVQPGAALAGLAEEVKTALKVVEDARSTEKILRRLQVAREEVIEQVNEVKTVKEGLVKMIKDSRREVKEIKGDVKNQIKWAKEEAETLKERMTAIRVKVAAAVEEGEERIRTLLDCERGPDATQCTPKLDPDQVGADYDYKSPHLEHEDEEGVTAIANDPRLCITRVNAPLDPARLAIGGTECSAVASPVDLTFDSPSAPVDSRSPFDMIRAIVDNLEVDYKSRIAVSSIKSIPSVPPPTPAPAPPVVADSRSQFIYPVSQGIVQENFGSPWPTDVGNSIPAQPVSEDDGLSTTGMDGSCMLSPTSQATTTMSDMEAALSQLRLDSRGEKGSVQGSAAQQEDENRAAPQGNPWPEEWPMFWEGGDPTGLGRDRDDRDDPRHVNPTLIVSRTWTL